MTKKLKLRAKPIEEGNYQAQYPHLFSFRTSIDFPSGIKLVLVKKKKKIATNQ